MLIEISPGKTMELKLIFLNEEVGNIKGISGVVSLF
jgi:hypothetical protein